MAWAKSPKIREIKPLAPLWHVTVTMGGLPVASDILRPALERLGSERGFLLSARYADRWAELSYWEEAESLLDAASLALRLWNEHRATADLPPWQVLGLEVVDEETYRRRMAECGQRPVASVGVIEPY